MAQMWKSHSLGLAEAAEKTNIQDLEILSCTPCHLLFDFGLLNYNIDALASILHQSALGAV